MMKIELKWCIISTIVALGLTGCVSPTASTTPHTSPTAIETPKANAQPLPEAPSPTSESPGPGEKTDSTESPKITGIDEAAKACNQWQTSFSQDDKTWPTTQAAAAELASKAAEVNPQWKAITSPMFELIALSKKDSSQANLEQGQKYMSALAAGCQSAGVTVNAG